MVTLRDQSRATCSYAIAVRDNSKYFVHELTFVLCFSSSFKTARSLTKRCFWTPTTLLEVGDIQNISLPLVKQNRFGYE